MTLSDRGWKRQAPVDPALPRAKVRQPRRRRVFTPGFILILLGLLLFVLTFFVLAAARLMLLRLETKAGK